jgi:hypothetical protein
VHVQRLTTYEIECGSAEEARTIVRELEEPESPEGEGIVKVVARIGV